MSNITIALIVSEIILAGKLSTNIEQVMDFLIGKVGTYDQAAKIAEILENEFNVVFIYPSEDDGMPTLTDFGVFV